MKFIYTIPSIVLMIFFTSCGDPLEITNPNELTSQTFYQNDRDAVASVNSVYSGLRATGISRWGLWLGELRADAMKSEAVNPDVINYYDRFIVTNYNFGAPGNYYVGSWRDYYVVVYRANQVIDNVPDIDMDPDLRSRLVAEARFLRGWAYYYLGLYWGNVPLMLSTSKPTDRPNSSTQAEVWTQALSDFEEAAGDLPTKSAYLSEDLGRVTKGAAYAMIGKTNMMLGDYLAAETALEWLVTGEGASEYSLVADYRTNFLSTTENNAESVFEIQYYDNPSETHGNDLGNPDQLNVGTSIAPFHAPQPIGFNTMEMGTWVLDEFLEETTTDGDRDPRVEASFLYKDTDVDGPDFTLVYGQTWSTTFPDPNSANHNRVHLRKFLNDATQNTDDFSSGNNYRSIRYADVLLLYAECLNENGSTSAAYSYVNQVRNRVGLADLEAAHPEIGNDPDLFLEQLKHERITELAGESHRWADLVRWGDLGPDLESRDRGFANFVIGKHELMPIPQQDIDFNPNLVQNPNW